MKPYLDRDRELFPKDSDYDSDIPTDLDREESVDFMDGEDGADESGEDTSTAASPTRMMFTSK